MEIKPIFRQHLFQHKWRYLIGTTLLSISLCLQLIIPRLLQVFTDGLQGLTITTSDILSLALWISVVGLGIFIFRSSSRIYIFRLSRILEREIRRRLFTHWESLPAEYYHQQRIGNLMAHAVNDVNILRRISMQGVFQTSESLILIVVALAMMGGTIDFFLTLLVVLPLPGLTYLTYRFRIKIRTYSKNVQEAIGELTSRVQEFCSGIRIIKTYTQEKAEMDKFTADNEQNVEANRRLIRANSTFTAFSQGIVGLSYLVSIVYGSILVMQDVITLGEFVAFNTYLTLLIGPIENLGKVINLLQQGKAADIRLREVLSTKSEIRDEEGVLDVTTINGNIEIKNLTFQYKGTQEPALKNINVSAKKGSVLAIVGKVGSGKSTLVNLLLRVYNPPRNTIFLDGYDIRDIPLQTLRKSVGYVPQDNFLFSTEISENISFDPNNYKDEQIQKAAKDANVYRDIIEFPQKFETKLGERGMSLSGGQRQRVSIARALIKQSSIMIFDDSLSAVDAKTEKAILQTLNSEMEGRTSIIISHRISTIKEADQIIVLDDGEIVEHGNHNTLLMANGIYKKMYDQQLTSLALDHHDYSYDERLFMRRRG